MLLVGGGGGIEVEKWRLRYLNFWKHVLNKAINIF